MSVYVDLFTIQDDGTAPALLNTPEAAALQVGDAVSWWCEDQTGIGRVVRIDPALAWIQVE